MRSCFLKGFGECSEKISREHYISATVLSAISPSGNIRIGGLPWQPKKQLQNIGIQSLQSKILCEKHNAGLTSLDSAAGALIRILDDIDKNPLEVPQVSKVDGSIIERWFIKVMCGLAAIHCINEGTIPEKWKKILVGEHWPDSWGLYLPIPKERRVIAPEFQLETLVQPETRVVLAASFSIAGVAFMLAMGKPDFPDKFGIYRPRGIIFLDKNIERRVEFIWPFHTESAVIYTKVGTTKDKPPQWSDWKE